MFVSGQNEERAAAPPSAEISKTEQRRAALKQDLHRRLIQALDHSALRNMDEPQVRQQLRYGAEELCRSRPDLLSPTERARLIDELVDETLGLGPLETLLRDATISDILINGPRTVYVERNGRLERSPITFAGEDQLLSTVQKIVGRVGRRVDESSPMVDARLPDGSRVNAIIPPLAIDGALVSIRRTRQETLQTEQLLQLGAASAEMLAFLAACVVARASILISGGTGSGKTTLLNVLSTYVPDTERIITIEDAAELRLTQPHVARLETRPPNVEGRGEVTARDLLRNALRMRPDRIIVGECRGGEAFDMLQAMNTGHEGSLSTLHANSTRDCISRLEMLVGLAGFELSPYQVGRQISAAINVLVHVARLADGGRKIVQISELQGCQQGEFQIVDLFSFEEQSVDDRTGVQGNFVTHGVLPKVFKKIEARGIALDPHIFTVASVKSRGHRMNASPAPSGGLS